MSTNPLDPGSNDPGANEGAESKKGSGQDLEVVPVELVRYAHRPTRGIFYAPTFYSQGEPLILDGNSRDAWFVFYGGEFDGWQGMTLWMGDNAFPNWGAFDSQPPEDDDKQPFVDRFKVLYELNEVVFVTDGTVTAKYVYRARPHESDLPNWIGKSEN